MEKLRVTMLLFILFAIYFQPAVFQSNITTFPLLQDNNIAAGYVGLTLENKFSKNEFYLRCNWILSNNRILEILTPLNHCNNRTEGNYDMTCIVSNDMIHTTITINEPIEFLATFQTLSSDYIANFSIHCNGLPVSKTISLTVRDCNQVLKSESSSIIYYGSAGSFMCNKGETLFYSSSLTSCSSRKNLLGKEGLLCQRDCNQSLDSGIFVNSTTNYFGSTGRFKCNDGEALFYSNNSLVVSPETSCSSDGKWINREGLFCRRDAPYQNESTVCQWILNHFQSCVVIFHSSATIHFVSLSKDGKRIQNMEILFQHSSKNRKNHIFFYKNNVVEADAGTYVLTLQKFALPYPDTIEFEIVVRDLASLFPITLSLIAVGTALGLSCAAIGYLLCLNRKNSKRISMSGAKPTDPSNSKVFLNEVSKDINNPVTGFNEDKSVDNDYVNITGKNISNQNENSYVNVKPGSSGGVEKNALIPNIPQDKVGYISMRPLSFENSKITLSSSK